MTLYTRHQLALLLLLVVAAGGGLAVDHWRRAHPDVAARLERLDQAEPRAAPDPPPGRRAHGRRPPVPDHDSTRRDAGRAARQSPRERPGREAPAVGRLPEAPLDVNRASVPELMQLPGIGPTLAARIVDARPFATPDDLARVRGLRAGTLARLRPWLTTLPSP